jgi:hypothetical protein
MSCKAWASCCAGKMICTGPGHPFPTRLGLETDDLPGNACVYNLTRVGNGTFAQKRSRLQLDLSCKRQRLLATMRFPTRLGLETQAVPGKAAVYNPSQVRNGNCAQKRLRLQPDLSCKRKRVWAKLPFLTQAALETQTFAGKTAVSNSSRMEKAALLRNACF